MGTIKKDTGAGDPAKTKRNSLGIVFLSEDCLGEPRFTVCHSWCVSPELLNIFISFSMDDIKSKGIKLDKFEDSDE